MTFDTNHQPTICAFIDILGFSSLVKNQDPRVEQYLRSFAHLRDQIIGGDLLTVAAISDSIIISTTFNKDDLNDSMENLPLSLSLLFHFKCN